LENLLENDSAFYDIVLAIDVLEHVEDYFGFLRALKSKGDYKIFHIPLDMSVHAVLRKSIFNAQRKGVGHLHYFTKETALETLKDAGYEILDHFFTTACLDMHGQYTLKSRMVRKMCYTVNKDFAVRLIGGFSFMVLAR
jgi:2-polyprenyl-3-methyl-5-hydroxy-6-metoxy-1,4-benzoquinol methylase